MRYTLEWYVSGEPFYTPPGILLAGVSAAVQRGQRRSAEALDRRRHLGRALHRAAWAPRSSSSACSTPRIHKVNECVRVADIDALHAMYLQALRKLL